MNGSAGDRDVIRAMDHRMNRGNAIRGNVTTIVIAEDHQVVRLGLELLLKSAPDFKLVGQAGDGFEAIQMVKLLEPDVLLLDLMIPQVHGLEVIRHVRAATPQTKVIILSMHNEERYVAESMRRGASGYVLKEASSSELIEAVRTVAAGVRYVSPPVAHFADRTNDGAAELSTADDEALTNRERLVLQLAADGLSSKEVAARLLISPRTAEAHRANLMRKLCLRSQTELVRFAIRKQIIAP